MTLRNIQIFIELYKQENVTKAAEALHMTQPAVTRALQDMEEYYGVRLFERMHRGITVTESGKALYAYSLHIADTFEQMEYALLHWDHQGVLRVGSSITIGNYMMPGIIRRFQAEEPDLHIRVMVNNSERIQEALLSNELDMALLEGEADRETFTITAFAGDRLVPVLPPEHPLAGRKAVSLSRLARERLLLRDPGSAGRQLLDGAFAAAGLSPQPLWESVSTQALVRAVSEGLGISVLPEQLVQDDLMAGHISTCTLKNVPLTRTFYMVWHRKKFVTRSMTRLTQIAEDFVLL